MIKSIVIAILVLSTADTWASTVISANFAVDGANAHGDQIAGTTTDVGDVTWRRNGSGNWRYNSTADGAAVNQNNAVDSNPRLYLDYASITDAGNVTTLSLKAQVVDCRIMNFGFGTDDNLMSSSAQAFWVRIPSNGVADVWSRNGGVNTRLSDGIQIKATQDDVLEISLSYSQASNTVWGFVAGGAATNTLAPTVLGFTPIFDQFNFELQNEKGDRTNAGYFDDVVVDAVALSPYEAWAVSFGLSGSPDADVDYDYDADGFDNLYEYGLGGDPTNAANQGISPSYSVGGGILTYVYPQRSDPNHGLDYHLETRDDLVVGGWTNSGYAVTGTNIVVGDFDYVTNEVSTAVKAKQFIELVIDTL